MIKLPDTFTDKDLAQYTYAYLLLKDDSKAEICFEYMANLMGYRMDLVEHLDLIQIMEELPKRLNKLQEIRKKLKHDRTSAEEVA